MNAQDRCALGLEVIMTERNQNHEKLAELSVKVLDEVFRLEKTGETLAAQAFEAFIPVDSAHLEFLAPIMGEEELEGVLKVYNQNKMQERRCYLVENDFSIPDGIF